MTTRLLCLILIASFSRVMAAPLDTNSIDHITGLKGAWNAAEGVFKVSSPRNDVAVTVDEWKMPPFMGLTSWAAFLAGKQTNAMVMGDRRLSPVQFHSASQPSTTKP